MEEHPQSDSEPLQVLSCRSTYKECSDNEWDLEFSHRMVVMRCGDDFFFARDPHRHGDIKPEALELEPIPKSHFRAPLERGLKIASHELVPSDSEEVCGVDGRGPHRHVYFKKPDLGSYGDLSPTEREAFFEPQLQEAKIYERLRLRPHPNLCTYHGCVVDGDGRIEGLFLERYDKTLAQLKKEGRLGVDEKRRYMDGARQGVQHMHSLGLVHGDLNPQNIMVKAGGGEAVVVDFDSCRPVGEPMGRKGGTPEWSPAGFPEFAAFEHDLYALELMEQKL